MSHCRMFIAAADALFRDAKVGCHAGRRSLLYSPRMNAPRIMVAAVLLGSVTSFIFIVCVLFSINDFDGLITSEYRSATWADHA